MTTVRRLPAVLLTLTTAAIAFSCSNRFAVCEETRTCFSDSEAGAGAAGDANGGSISGGGGQGGTTAAGSAGDAGAAGGGNCDTTKAPGEEGCLVSDDFAVFVAPTGDDKNDGTQQSPFATLTKAAEVAGNKLVLVCSGTYDEHVSIAAGVRIYGGFKCADWSADEEKPLVLPTSAGPALSIDGVDDEVSIESVSFEVGDAVDAGETALTALVNASPKVTLRGVSLKAGKEVTGANGSLTDFAFPEQTSLDGNSESPTTMGGASKKCECQPTLSSTGGLGGTPVDGGQAESKGQPDHGAGGPGTPGSCGSGGTGQDGQDAPAAAAAPGAPAYGSAAAGWTPAAGTDGSIGQPGQGDGGGASRNASGHGGGGGCGGCGGNGGTAGKGGGASIALLALNSPVTLEASELTTADAGNGGSGAAGQAGQSEVGNGGNSIASTNSCGGGSGGKGGAGGAGGGGAGGISVGIVWKGTTAPTADADTTITNGKAGAKGTGGDAGNNDGIAGVAQKLLQLN